MNYKIVSQEKTIMFGNGLPATMPNIYTKKALLSHVYYSIKPGFSTEKSSSLVRYYTYNIYGYPCKRHNIGKVGSGSQQTDIIHIFYITGIPVNGILMKSLFRVPTNIYYTYILHNGYPCKRHTIKKVGLGSQQTYTIHIFYITGIPVNGILLRKLV